MAPGSVPSPPVGVEDGAPVAPLLSLASGLVTPSLASVEMAAGAATVEKLAEESAALVATSWSQESAPRGLARGSHAAEPVWLGCS